MDIKRDMDETKNTTNTQDLSTHLNYKYANDNNNTP